MSGARVLILLLDSGVILGESPSLVESQPPHLLREGNGDQHLPCSVGGDYKYDEVSPHNPCPPEQGSLRARSEESKETN